MAEDTSSPERKLAMAGVNQLFEIIGDSGEKLLEAAEQLSDTGIEMGHSALNVADTSKDVLLAEARKSLANFLESARKLTEVATVNLP